MAEGPGLRDRATKVLAADHFAALGLPRTASPEDVRKAFVDAARTWHPDRAPQGDAAARSVHQQVFARLEVARNVLTDPPRRLKYLEELGRPQEKTDAAKEADLAFRKAEVLLKKSDPAGAEQHLRRAVQLAPENVDYQTVLLSLRVKPGSTADELRRLVGELDRLLAKDDRCARAFFLRAQLKKRLELPKEAFADFGRAASMF